ncbi:unnamed protein product [Adineta steineri]|uniref:Uncharacterized protein n=2 Tax=Adineta steineri TaxID=433720 RepID=A0A819RYY2_9BILA|nr:unnamed protein product [Adineta steineri]
MDGIRQRITNEIFHIAGVIYRTLIRPIIIMGCIFIPVYYIYVSIICQNAGFIPFIHKFCPGREINMLSYLPLESLTENTMSLAKTLSDADVTAPMHCVHAKLAFIEIRAEIMESDIKSEIKNNLAATLLDLQKLMETGADQSTSMLISFNSALDAINIHTEFLLDDLSKSKNSNNYQRDQLQIESSNMKTTDLATHTFNDYTDAINEQIDKVLIKAQEFDATLNWIISKIETIQNLIKKGKQISDTELDQLLKDSFWAWLFGKDVVSIRKHQRNIKTLKEFNDFIRELSKNIAGIITDLKRFKSHATDTKETAAQLHTLQYKSPERQLAIIKASLNRLAQARQAFEKRMVEENREKYI